MTPLNLHDEHLSHGACFCSMNGAEMVSHYGNPAAEYDALRSTAGLFDLSGRGRLGVTGADRQRYLNGQVTNNVRDLRPGEGCYAVVVNAKGRIQGDMNVFCLADELLLDCEPGFGLSIARRLERFIIADEVQVTDISDAYGLLSVQGPRSADVFARAYPGQPLPAQDWSSQLWPGEYGDVCAVNLARSGLPGMEVLVPRAELGPAWKRLAGIVTELGGRPCGWECLEWARIETGIPRYGQDMDERNLASEAGIETRAISYTKGCYIGQEIISRIRSVGKVTRSLRGLEFDDPGLPLPRRGDLLTRSGREVGYITSVIHSPGLGRPVGLGYVRREIGEPGDTFEVQTEAGSRTARLRTLPPAGGSLSRPGMTAGQVN